MRKLGKSSPKKDSGTSLFPQNRFRNSRKGPWSVWKTGDFIRISEWIPFESRARFTETFGSEAFAKALRPSIRDSFVTRFGSTRTGLGEKKSPKRFTPSASTGGIRKTKYSRNTSTAFRSEGCRKATRRPRGVTSENKRKTLPKPNSWRFS